MRKRISRLFNRRHLMRAGLCLAILTTIGGLGIVNGMAYEEMPVKKAKTLKWVSGTAPGQADFLSLDWSILEQPDDPMVGDSICFEFTATNISPDTLNNVVIAKGSTIASAPTLLPYGVMAGSGVNVFTGSGTFVLTGSGCSVLTATDIANGFVVCPAATIGLTDDMPPTLVSDCVDAIACFGVTLTCTDYNISLDAECEVLLTPELLSINTKVPDSLLRIRIQNPNGDFRDRPFVDSEDVDGRVKVVVDIPGCANVAPCWSYAYIDYKLGPSQICTTDTVTCAQQVAMDDPTITFACGATQFIRGEVQRIDLCLTDSNFIAKEIITYAVQDQFGNISDTCVQVRYILKPNLERGDIIFPDDQTVISCEQNVFDTDGSILPFFSGVPTWDGLDLTDRALPQSCNILTEFEDVITLERDCEMRVIRKWTVREWLCEGGFNEFSDFQTIILRDTTPPTIDVQSALINLTVNQSDCTARFEVPDAVVTDNCQPDSTIEVEVRYPGGSSLTSVTNVIFLPLGDSSLVEYIARDRCGNESRDSLYVNVVDNTTPVAICLRETVISLTAESATMGVDKFDEDSYDACGIDRICVVRMDDQLLLTSLDLNNDGEVLFEVFDLALQLRADDLEGCYRDYSMYAYERAGNLYISVETLCTPAVKFCCVDANKDVPVILRAYDMSGNFNECMVMVGVQDKSDPIITCPTDTITVSCDFEFDTAGNLDDLFGTIRNGLTPIPLEIPAEFKVDSSGPLVNGTYLDNCNLGRVIEDRVVDRDSICRTGTIIRRFSIIRGGDTVQVCEQLIRIVGDQNNNPLEWEFFPDTEKIVAQTPDDVRLLAINNPPRVKNVGCSLIGLGHRDQFFNTNEGPYCTKIVRTWEVIDWCRNPTGLVELDSIQYIFVTDNEAPEVVFNSPITIPQPLAGSAIELVATATDNVVDNPRWLDWRYEVYAGSQVVPILADTIRPEDFRNSSAVIRLVDLAIGDYEINWIVTDKCMNTDTAVQTLTIAERKQEGELNVVGQVLFSKGGNMDQIDVFLTEEPGIYGAALKTVTDGDGEYAFDNMPTGGEYFIDPKKNDDPLNGVSTLDLIMIQRHILGIRTLENAALQVAADVNNDKGITALDLVQLRRLLLGQIDNFTNKDSWTFVYEGQDLEETVENRGILQESYHISELVEDMDISFLGIKTGDVSGDAVGHSSGLADNRSSQSVTWTYEVTQSNGIAMVSVKASEDIDIQGFQSTWTWADHMQLSSVEPGKLRLDEANYNMAESESGSLPMSFSEAVPVGINASDVLFTLVFTTDGLDSKVSLAMDESRFLNEVYNEGEVYSLDINKEITQADQLVLTLAQNTPNPWSETTVIHADMPISGEAYFRIYDLHNRMIHKEMRVVARGSQSFTIDNNDITESGLYFYEVEIGGFIARQKMIRVK